jgi:1,4-dihydroxy-2-naphthoyl-CoA hydrolase
MNLLENIRSRPLPLVQLMGITFTHAEHDKVIARMVVRPDLCTLGHTIHGGSAMAFADTTGGAATLINLPAGANGTTTIESKTNFVGAAKEGSTVIATATPLHRGRRTQVWQTRRRRCRHHHSPTSAMQPAGQDPETRLAFGTVTVPLCSRTNATPFWIMLLLVLGRSEHGMAQRKARAPPSTQKFS